MKFVGRGEDGRKIKGKKKPRGTETGRTSAGDVMALTLELDGWMVGLETLRMRRASAAKTYQKPLVKVQCLGWRSSGGYRGVVDAEGARPDWVVR